MSVLGIKMSAFSNTENLPNGLSDYESGEIIGQLEALEYIRQRYKTNS